MPLVFILPVLSTLLGGLLALRLRAYLTFLLSLGSGLLLGAALLDLLPEALAPDVFGHLDVAAVGGIVLLSFLSFYLLGRVLQSAAQSGNLSARAVSRIGVGLLIFHSLRDGVALGLAYAASHTAGFAVAAGIVTHDLGDGLNTVLLSSDGKRPGLADYTLLLADALAPLAGALLTQHWHVTQTSSVVLLAMTCGFFLQMVATDFLPRALADVPARHLIAPAMLAGVAMIYASTLLVRHRW